VRRELQRQLQLQLQLQQGLFVVHPNPDGAEGDGQVEAPDGSSVLRCMVMLNQVLC
jgi:hypothetical protein